MPLETKLSNLFNNKFTRRHQYLLKHNFIITSKLFHHVYFRGNIETDVELKFNNCVQHTARKLNCVVLQELFSHENI